jgi:hypothetical protein
MDEVGTSYQADRLWRVMKRVEVMPVWPIGIVAALASGMLIGARLAVPSHLTAKAESTAMLIRLPSVIAQAPHTRDLDWPQTDATQPVEWEIVDAGDLGLDGGEYTPPDGSIEAMPYRAFAAAPDSLGAMAGAVSGSVVGVEPPAPAPRLRPVQRASTAAALQVPLLVRRRGGDRVVFYEMSSRPAVIEGGLKGDWSVVGACANQLRLDFEQGAARFGSVRGVGRTSAELPGEYGLAVPAQACSAASGRFSRPRGGNGSVGDGGWIWSAEHSRISVHPEHASNAAFIRDVDGTAYLIGVYRRGRVQEGWYVVTQGSRLVELLRLSVDAGTIHLEASPIAGG